MVSGKDRPTGLSTRNRACPRLLLSLAGACLLMLLSSQTCSVDGLNHYEVLEVTQDSNSSEIKKAYRRLSLSYHPDKNKAPDAVEKFNAIASAYQVLSDEERRAEYDDSFEMMFEDVTGDFAGFLRKLWKIVSDLWQELESLEMPFSSVLCMGLDVSVLEPVMGVYHSFFSTDDDDNDEFVILEQQYPGLALGEAVSQLWLQNNLCGGEAPGNEGKGAWKVAVEPWHPLVIGAAAAAFWFFRGRTLMFAALGYMVLLVNIPQESNPVWRTKRGFIAMESWAEAAQLPVLLSVGYMTFLQVSLVFLGSLPLHLVHRAVVGSLLTAVVSAAVSGALLSIWWPVFLTQIPGVKLAHVLLPGLVLLGGCWFPLDIVKRPCLALRRGLTTAWLWPFTACAKVAEGYILLPLGMAPFTEHPYWMRWLRWLSVVVVHRFPLWLLDKWSHLVSYFVISCLLFMLAGRELEAIRELHLLHGLLANLGGAVLLWAARAQVIRMGIMSAGDN